MGTRLQTNISIHYACPPRAQFEEAQYDLHIRALSKSGLGDAMAQSWEASQARGYGFLSNAATLDGVEGMIQLISYTCLCLCFFFPYVYTCLCYLLYKRKIKKKERKKERYMIKKYKRTWRICLT